MVDRIIQLQSNKIIHGLHYMWGIPDSVPGLLSAKKPTLQLAVKTGSVVGLPTRFKNPFYLTGGDSMPTAATRAVVLSGTIAPQTLRATFHGIPVGADGVAGTLADGPYHDVEVEYDVQTSDTLTTAMTAWKAVINIAIAGSGTPTNGRIRCSNKRALLSDIGVGMALKYANATDSSGTLTFNGAATGGTTQNSYDITVEIIAKAPGILSAANNIVNVPGAYFLGATQDPALDLSATENNIDCGQAFNEIDSYVSATAAKLSGQVLEDGNIRTQRLLQQIADEFSTNSYKGFLPNFLPGGQTGGLVLLTDSQEYPGNNDIMVIRKIRSNSVKYEFKKTHTPVPFNMSAVKPDEDDLIQILKYTPVAA